MKRFLLAMICAAGAMLAGCTVAELGSGEVQEIAVGQSQGEGFTLVANYGEPGTKVAFDEDGLNMSWQPGDVLYLVDYSGKNVIPLETSIIAPAKTASFYTKATVAPGTYVVLYGQSTLDVKNSIEMTSINYLAKQIRLYGTITVEEGQTTSSLSLSQMFAMLTFKFRNLPNLTDMTLGMASATEALPDIVNGTIKSKKGLVPSDAKQMLYNFSWNNGKEGKSFILPVDLSSQKLYFFIYGTNADGDHVTYEFVKDGKNLKAGVNYNLTFNFDNASAVSTLWKKSSNTYYLYEPQDFRAAAFWNKTNTYYVEYDMDFNGEVYFPVKANTLFGNKHTLKNISVNIKNLDKVGVLSSGTARDLTVKNSSFIGYDYVGAIAGEGNSSFSCCADGVSVQGHSYVGGLYGSSSSPSACTLIGISSVTGTGDYVGGIVGRTDYIDKCFAKGQISVAGGDYTGGLAGYAGYTLMSGFEGNVEGKMNCGGISGYGSVSESYVFGDVTGTKNVGGISNYCTCLDSYHIGDTTGDTNVGGIVGYAESDEVFNCYSYGTTSSGYGISNSSPSYNSDFNLTSEEYLYPNVSNDNCNCGPSKTFVSKLSVINGSNAFSTQTWPDIDAGCPLLQWQSEGFGGDIVIPGFDDEDW